MKAQLNANSRDFDQDRRIEADHIIPISRLRQSLDLLTVSMAGDGPDREQPQLASAVGSFRHGSGTGDLSCGYDHLAKHSSGPEEDADAV